MFPGPGDTFQVFGKLTNNPDISFQGFDEMKLIKYIWKHTVHTPNNKIKLEKGYNTYLKIEYVQGYLESFQNERLSNWGMTKVAFIICATATMSDIYKKKGIITYNANKLWKNSSNTTIGFTQSDYQSSRRCDKCKLKSLYTRQNKNLNSISPYPMHHM